MAWEKVIAPIEYGGLGFGSLRDANLAMLSKWWWRFKTDKDGLWRRVVWAVHHNNRSWSPIPAKISLAGPWKQIVSICDHLNKVGIKLSESIWCKVGAGSKVSFWLDLWIGNQPLYVAFPLLFALEKIKTCRISDRVSWEADRLCLSWVWNRPVMSDYEEAELLDLTCLLCDFSHYEGPDVWVWKHGQSETFSVASIKNTMETANRSVPADLFLWNNFIPKKVGVVSWRARSERLLTRVALAARNMNIGDTRCPLCAEYDETSDHLFVSCHFSQSIWLIIAQWCRIPPMVAFSFKDILDTHISVYGSKKKKKVISVIIQVVIWSIWRMRNEVIFGLVEPNISKVVEESKSMAYHWIKNRSRSHTWSWSEWRNFNIVM
ncbi:putative reverse transcriptase zinc-binding domain-containing protein [Helianthus annuus]|nr:putative reverse transcriptase zinc-binding domain-containing protein [Helianthus annuus]